MSGPMRVDWPLLKQRMEAAGVDPAASCLICVTEAGRQLFLAISERLTWRATFRTDGYSYDDWNELQMVVDDTIGALSMADCTSIVNSIVTQVVNQVNNHVTTSQYYTDACCYLETNPVNVPEPSPAEPPGNSGERDELCIQAQIGHDGGYDFLEQVFLFMEAGGGLTAAVIALLLGPISLPFALLALIVGFLVTIFTDLNTDDVLDAWLQMKKDIVCGIVNSVTAEGAKAVVDQVIDGLTLPEIVKDAFKILYSQAAINQIWERTLDDPGGYSADYCSDCTEWSIVGGIAFDVVDFVGTGCAWNGGVGGTQWVNNVLEQLNPPTGFTFCYVGEGLEAHYIGDLNTNVGFNPFSSGKLMAMGISYCLQESGSRSVRYSNFKVLVATNDAPDNWFWIDAELIQDEENQPGLFEVTPGVGSEGEVFVSIGPGTSTRGENVKIDIPS